VHGKCKIDPLLPPPFQKPEMGEELNNTPPPSVPWMGEVGRGSIRLMDGGGWEGVRTLHPVRLQSLLWREM